MAFYSYSSTSHTSEITTTCWRSTTARPHSSMQSCMHLFTPDWNIVMPFLPTLCSHLLAPLQSILRSAARVLRGPHRVPGLLVHWTVRTPDCSYCEVFVPSWTICTMDHLYRPWTFRTLDDSYFGLLVPSLDDSYHVARLTNINTCTMDVIIHMNVTNNILCRIS